MDLEGLIRHMDFGIQTWNDKKLRRAVLPAVARAMGQRTAAREGAVAEENVAGIRGQAFVASQRIDAKSKGDVATMEDAGKTHRTGLLTASNELVKRIGEAGGIDKLITAGDVGERAASQKDMRDRKMLNEFGSLLRGGSAPDDETLDVLREAFETMSADKEKKRKDLLDDEILEKKRFSLGNIDTEIYTPGQ